MAGPQPPSTAKETAAPAATGGSGTVATDSFAAALAALPPSLQPRPLYAASQLTHFRWTEGPAQPAGSGALPPFRILELLDRPDDPACFAGVEQALAVAVNVAQPRTAWLAAGGDGAAFGETFDVIYLHPCCEDAAEIRALLPRLRAALAPTGVLWLQLIDPLFAPAPLPPAGRKLPAVSAWLTALRAAGLAVALRSTRGVYLPELAAQWQAAWRPAWATHFMRGFPAAPWAPAAGCGLPTPGATAGSGAQALVRDGLLPPAQDAAGRWFRGRTAAAAAVITVDFGALPKNAGGSTAPGGGPAAAGGNFRRVRLTIDTPPSAAAPAVAWLGAPAWRLGGAEPAGPDLPPGRQVQVWSVAAAGGLAHVLLAGPEFARLESVQVESEPAAVGDFEAVLVALPREFAARHRAVTAALAADPAVQTVLDVGGAPGLLAALLPDRAVTTVDTAHGAEHPGFVRLAAVTGPTGQAGRLPFADASFDAVTAVDVLEHIPPAARAGFVAELARVARRRLWLACPVDSAAARAAEAALATALPMAHAFLEEHRQFGLPAAEAVAGWLTAAGKPAGRCEAGASVADWLAATAADLGLTATPEPNWGGAAETTVYRWNWVWSA